MLFIEDPPDWFDANMDNVSVLKFVELREQSRFVDWVAGVSVCRRLVNWQLICLACDKYGQGECFEVC